MSHYTAKGVACETRSEPPPSPASLAVGLTPRAKRTRLLALLDVRNATSPCSCFCCTNSYSTKMKGTEVPNLRCSSALVSCPDYFSPSRSEKYGLGTRLAVHVIVLVC